MSPIVESSESLPRELISATIQQVSELHSVHVHSLRKDESLTLKLFQFKDDQIHVLHAVVSTICISKND